MLKNMKHEGAACNKQYLQNALFGGLGESQRAVVRRESPAGRAKPVMASEEAPAGQLMGKIPRFVAGRGFSRWASFPGSRWQSKTPCICGEISPLGRGYSIYTEKVV